MDYILRKLNRRIQYHQSTVTTSPELPVLYRAKIEYCLLFWLGYLWNRNIDKLDSDSKAYLLDKIQRPSIGTIVDLSRRLDVTKELFKDKELAGLFNKWPEFRNEALGHGYIFGDKTDTVSAALRELSQKIDSTANLVIAGQVELVHVDRSDGVVFSGTLYTSDGEYHAWHMSCQALPAHLDETYAVVGGTSYHRLSPFVSLRDEDEIYIFKSVKEPLTGSIEYNRLIRTGTAIQEWRDFAKLDLEVDGVRRLAANRTVINTFDLNYKQYIDVGLKGLVTDFLTKNTASVCATIWGHGGVGKTAAVQSVCEELTSIGRSRVFDYIVFASAKDRYYNYLTGAIQSVDEDNRVNSFEGIIRLVNRIISRTDEFDLNAVQDAHGRVLLIVDDYETFPTEEKRRIEEFIRTLDINRHKVLITTRANLVIGEEIRCNELTAEQTRRFLIEVVRVEFPQLNPASIEQQLADPEQLNNLQRVTNGRPLFIYHFAHVWMRSGAMPRALKARINTSEAAIEFLYGRIYDYLTDTAKNIFVVLSLLTTQDDLTGVVDKIRYVLSLESDKDTFEAGVQELVKLKIIELREGGFFQVYSREIYEFMARHFQTRDEGFRQNWRQRVLQIGKDKKLENDRALLNWANAARYSRSEEEVNSSYRQILNRASAPIAIRLQATINLASFYVLDRGKREAGIRVLEDYAHLFPAEPQYVKFRASLNWSAGNGAKAVTILAEAIDHTAAKNWRKVDKVDVLGLLVTYKSLYWIQKREESKDEAAIQDVTLIRKRSEWAEQKREFEGIIQRHGRQLQDLLRTVDVSALTAAARQNTVTGLLQLVEICIRVSRYDFGREICLWVLDNVSHSAKPDFQNKLARIDDYMAGRARKKLYGTRRRQC
jgi:hypothetical protein